MDKLTVEDWLTSSGKYPWRARHEEVTPGLLKHAADYVARLNALCDELRIKRRKFSSGFRPTDVNKKTPNASKTSTHMLGLGGDLEDADRAITTAFLTNLNVLEKHGLYLEDPKYTPTWCHTQTRAPKSGKRIFIP
jgi:hypothetical protein